MASNDQPERNRVVLTPEEIEQFSEVDLPEGVTANDALRAFMEVDPKKVKDPDKQEKTKEQDR